MQDMARKGRHAHVIPDDTIESIRRRAAAGESQVVMCREFGISRTHVNNVVNGKRRGRVTVDPARGVGTIEKVR